MTSNLLLVDDQPNLVRGIARHLRSNGLTIHMAFSAEEAIEVLKSRPIDVVVSDERMPGMQGSELCAWIAQYYPDIVRIILTGQASIEAAVRAVNEGRIYRFLEKPFDPEKLREIVLTALSEREAAKEQQHMLESTQKFMYEADSKNKQLETELNKLSNESENLKDEIDSLLHEKQNLAYSAGIQEQYFASITHEFRSPLTALLTSAEAIGDNVGGEEYRQKWLEVLRSSGRHVMELVNNVLDNAKIRSGRFELNSTNFSPREVAKEVEPLFRLEAERRNVEYDFIVAENTPEQMKGDPLRLKQVLINLLSNAFKFTQTGSVRAEIFGGFDCQTLVDTLEISIQDTGEGMSPEQLSQLFEPFTQAKSELTAKEVGTGLGLSIVQQLVNLMGGELKVQSALGKGTRFSIRIPLANSPKKEPTPKPVESKTAGKSRDLTGRMLVADDSLDLRKMLKFILERAGASVEVAENGREALIKTLEAAESQDPFDLIFLDLEMPEMNGVETLREIRANGQNTPIVVLTGCTSETWHQQCYDAGCNGIISKPVEKETLLEFASNYVSTGFSL